MPSVKKRTYFIEFFIYPFILLIILLIYLHKRQKLKYFKRLEQITIEKISHILCRAIPLSVCLDNVQQVNYYRQ